MAWNQTDLQKLEDAIKQGALKVRYGDKEVTYRSLDEMIRLREMMRSELGQAIRQPRKRLLSFSKGLG